MVKKVFGVPGVAGGFEEGAVSSEDKEGETNAIEISDSRRHFEEAGRLCKSLLCRRVLGMLRKRS